MEINQEGKTYYYMDRSLIQFIKKPTVFRSVYFIACLIIAFGLGIITHYMVSNRGNDPVFTVPTQPIPLAMRYKSPTVRNVYDYVPAETVIAPGVSSPTVGVPSAAGSGSNQGEFVASKTGTKYYPKDCGSISRIKEENRIYFATEKEAQDKGYARTESCT